MAACVHICPDDLMRLDRDGTVTGHPMQAYNQEPAHCWACFACIKACPRDAIASRAAADIAPLGGAVKPQRGDDTIVWDIAFRNGRAERFTYPVRTLPAGDSAPPDRGGEADIRRIADTGFFDTQGGYRPGDPDQLINR
jgi:adenylylsulfate reductase subunit B